MSQISDLISQEDAGNLHGLFQERVRRSPQRIAYRHYYTESEQWEDINWQQMADDVARWQAALARENLESGARVGLILRNCPEWVKFEQAALGLGLVVVPLYTNDRPDNIAYIIDNADVKCLLFEGEEHWQVLQGVMDRLGTVQRFISLHYLDHQEADRLTAIDQWLPDKHTRPALPDIEPRDLASIVYTSGTTGKPKGVMLSHENILWNACACAKCERFYNDDMYLSFLPLSHMFERTAGYYLPMVAGSTVAYARSIEQLAEDLVSIRPTILVSVPRIYERVNNKIKAQLETKSPLARKLFLGAVATGWQMFEHQQGRDHWRPGQLLWPVFKALVAKKIMQKLGGRLRIAVCGGAPLPTDVARTFIGLGLPLLQGYGMTELSPVATVNRRDNNDPASVGTVLDDVEVQLGENDELLVRSPGIMKGYWNNEEATRELIDDQGWLHTGDVARIDNGFVYITGRIKDIIVMANGEKVPPADIEMAIASDPLFDQAMVIGEGKPFLSCITVLNPDSWQKIAGDYNLDPDDSASLENETIIKLLLDKINHQLHDFPGYANIYCVKATLAPWTIEEGLITPTLKLKRNELIDKFRDDIDRFYKGH
ncbi:AMP-dependent synthetase/ligase [Thiohalophilus thiocyanatoxydans]|uniref:Long-chain acyl-CoA synthetase n=1 Tax=Thiohalophilus thiocyanatoxydans TaxID=381308 RepID=A0A4R8IQM9_9GAMM|nr:long-chain fatty acid--CoA ligase [Thiohalophilus thiocyanatoxydans]TDY02888.1 long-chain acyl-CoA synthetase [Thiohalophilus thiocyanatoxydans]